jgi:hypothetical protein
MMAFLMKYKCRETDGAALRAEANTGTFKFSRFGADCVGETANYGGQVAIEARSRVVRFEADPLPMLWGLAEESLSV